MDSDDKNKNNLKGQPNLSENSIALLNEFHEVWEKLQSAPDGRYPIPNNYCFHLPPDGHSYWKLLEQIFEIACKLSKELNEENQIYLFEFRHSMDKEGAIIRDFEWKSGCNEEKKAAKLGKLMREFNERLHRELYSIFLLRDQIGNKI